MDLHYIENSVKYSSWSFPAFVHCYSSLIHPPTSNFKEKIPEPPQLHHTLFYQPPNYTRLRKITNKNVLRGSAVHRRTSKKRRRHDEEKRNERKEILNFFREQQQKVLWCLEIKISQWILLLFEYGESKWIKRHSRNIHEHRMLLWVFTMFNKLYLLLKFEVNCRR